jgi:hypothetical protein
MGDSVLQFLSSLLAAHEMFPQKTERAVYSARFRQALEAVFSCAVSRELAEHFSTHEIATLVKFQKAPFKAVLGRAS